MIWHFGKRHSLCVCWLLGTMYLLIVVPLLWHMEKPCINYFPSFCYWWYDMIWKHCDERWYLILPHNNGEGSKVTVTGIENNGNRCAAETTSCNGVYTLINFRKPTSLWLMNCGRRCITLIMNLEIKDSILTVICSEWKHKHGISLSEMSDSFAYKSWYFWQGY